MPSSESSPPKPEVLSERPLVPDPALGPYRRRDYLQLPDQPRTELIRGRLYACPSLTPSHQLAVATLRTHFEPIEAAGGLAFALPLDVHLADHSVVQPDGIVVSAARLKIVRDWVEGIPDLLVEVVSPESGRTDRLEKLMLYAESGVPECWIVDLDLQVIDCLVNDESGRYVLCPPTDGRYRSLRLPEIQLDVLEFCRDLERKLVRLRGPRAATGA
jgi:Uma2 family endonuclease